MTRTSRLLALLGTVGASLCLVACGSEAPPLADEPDTLRAGMLRAPLVGTSSANVEYRLRNAVFAIDGPSPIAINSEDFLGQADADVPLSAGAYTIALTPGWTLERSEGNTFALVAATLASPAVQPFTIVENQRSTVAFRFTAGDDVLDVGKPGLGLAIEVDDPPMHPVMPNQLAMLPVKVCGIRADRTVVCNDGLEPLGKGQFEKIFGDPVNAYLCGLGYPNHDIRCDRDFVVEGRRYSPPAGAYTSLALDSTGGCATATSGGVSCWGPRINLPAVAASGERYSSVALVGSGACAVGPSFLLNCWNAAYTQTGAVPAPARKMTSLSSSPYFACGIGTDRTAMCWGAGTDGQFLAPGGKFLKLAVGAHHVCGVRTDQSLACWGYDVYGEASPPSGNDFVDVAAGFEVTCALRANGTIACWGFSKPDAAPDLLAITVPPMVRAPQVGAWTALVPLSLNNDDYQDLLYYDAATGRALFTAGTATPGQETVAYETAYAPGWTDIVPARHTEESSLTDLTFYDAVSGKFSTTIATGAPGVQTPHFEGAGTAGFSSLVPMAMDADARTDSLWYNATTGQAIFGASMGAYSDVMYAPGWTSIIPVHLNADLLTDLLFYNRTTGAVTLTVAGGPAVQLHLADLKFGARLTVVPLDINGDHLTDWMRYDENTGIAVYTLNLGNGETKDLRTVQGPKGQKVFAPMMNSRARKTSFIATIGQQ